MILSNFQIPIVQRECELYQFLYLNQCSLEFACNLHLFLVIWVGKQECRLHIPCLFPWSSFIPSECERNLWRRASAGPSLLDCEPDIDLSWVLWFLYLVAERRKRTIDPPAFLVGYVAFQPISFNTVKSPFDIGFFFLYLICIPFYQSSDFFPEWVK